ncbi:hypothetical protein ACIQU5_27535 [Streptomyces sp. NPDC090306]|uniref:hypothetical protein n=1 Tax=unclassified Streptomyces TaxID=2593676 RepID=UPI0036EE84C4
MTTSEGADDEPGGEPVESVVLDLADLSPDDVAALPPSVLAETLHRLREGATNGPYVTGHSESL